MKAAKTSRNLKEIPSKIYQKKFSKRKENNITPAKTNAPISQTWSERLKLTIQTYGIRNKEFKMKLSKYQKHLCQLARN